MNYQFSATSQRKNGYSLPVLLLLLSLLLSACTGVIAVDGAPETPTNPAEKVAPVADARVIIADSDAGGLFVYGIPDWQPIVQFPALTFADHPGYIALPDGRLLFTTQSNELVILDTAIVTPTVAAQVALPGTVIHLAVDPALTFVAVSTMHNEETGFGADTITRIDLATLATSQVQLTTGEPGVLVGEGVVLHRDGDAAGLLESFPLESFGDERATAASYVDIGAYGHGEAMVNDNAYIATDDGIDIVHIDGVELTHATVLPWNVSGREGGRGYYMRADAHGNLWSYLRIVPNPESDTTWANWQDWQNDAYLIDTTAQTAQRFELGSGLVYRMALSSKYALYSRLHPDGDEAILFDADRTSATFAQLVGRIPLPATSQPPVAGEEPWDAAGQRITGLTPDGAWGFVSGGGDGVIQVIDTASQTIVAQIETPTPLNRGGYILVVQPGQPLSDNMGR